MALLRYGLNAQLEIDLAPPQLVGEFEAPHGEPLSDVRQATRQVLAAPLGYPPLASAVVPGDRATLALAPGTPLIGQVAAATTEALVEAGLDPANITWLLTADDPLAVEPRDLLTTSWRESVRLLRHNPTNRDELGYLAATPSGKAIYLNRAIYDADVVVPIGMLRTSDAAAYQGVYEGIYPTFSDETNQRRYRNPALVDIHSKTFQGAHREVEGVGQLSGIQFAVQVVPGSSQQLLAIYAGEAEQVFRVGQERCDEAWRFVASGSADLVLAGIEGDSDQQTWESVGRALMAARRVVSDQGLIVLCTELSTGPGEAIQQLAAVEDASDALRVIRKQRSSDTLAASELAEVVAQTRIGLLSRLEPTLVEDLGLSPIDDAQDLVRLAQRSRSCILLCGAQHVMASCAE